MKELTELLSELAVKLGITVDRLWIVLLKQAPISGMIDLLICIAFVTASIFLFRFVQKKTTPQKGEKYADWVEEEKVWAWIGTAFFIGVSGLIVLFSVESIVAAFFNPEYWALTKILSEISSSCK